MTNLITCIQNILFGLFITILSSCATKSTYRFLAGVRAENYVENESVPIDQALAQTIGGTVTTVSGNPNQVTLQGAGFQIGFVEETSEAFVTSLAFFMNNYTTVSYTFDSSNFGIIKTKVAPTGSGLDATIGYNFLKGSFKIRPDLSYKIESQSYTTTVSGSSSTTNFISNYKQSITVYGGGIAFEYAADKENRLVLQFDYRVPSKSVPGVSSLSYTSAQLSFLFGNWLL